MVAEIKDKALLLRPTKEEVVAEALVTIGIVFLAYTHVGIVVEIHSPP